MISADRARWSMRLRQLRFTAPFGKWRAGASHALPKIGSGRLASDNHLPFTALERSTGSQGPAASDLEGRYGWKTRRTRRQLAAGDVPAWELDWIALQHLRRSG